MTRPLRIAPVLLCAALACRSPVPTPRHLDTRPLQIRVKASARDGSVDLDGLYGEAVRDRLANQALVLSKGVDDAEAAVLDVALRFLDSRGELVGEAAVDGFAAGFGAGWKLTGKSGDGLKAAVRDAAAGVMVGTVFGIVAAPVSAATAEARALFHNARLGYKPRHLEVEVSLRRRADEQSEPLFKTSAFEVVKAMRPMTNGEAREPGRLKQEEAAALARVISKRLEADFGWRQRALPRVEAGAGQP